MNKTSVILIHSFPDRKIKSLGNRALISIGKSNIIDYQIQFIKNLVRNPEIIVVGGFEHKKLSKHIHKKHSNIKYIYHEITDTINIGLSVKLAVRVATGNELIIINGNILIDKRATKDIKSKYKHINCILSTKQNKSTIGCIKDANNILQNCFFDLPQPIYDFISINKQSLVAVKDIIYETADLEKFYLFEIYNAIINRGIDLYTIDIDSRQIDIIDNIDIIQKITRKKTKYA